MFRLELTLRGRKLSILVGLWWAWSWTTCAGALLVEAGPVRCAVFSRRLTWTDLE
jgi:hypothetical protein